MNGSYRASTISIAAFLAFGWSAQAVTFNNTNFGLIPGEQELLNVENPHSSLIEEFDYTVTGPFSHTTVPLQDGLAYKITISGRVGIGPLDGSNNSTPDAAYTFVNWQDLDLVHVPFNIPATVWVTSWDGVLGRRPSPDQYSTQHIYDYYLEGHGVGLNFTFTDNPYSDNIGGFHVQIFELGAVPDAGSSVLLLGIGSTALLFLRRPRQ